MSQPPRNDLTRWNRTGVTRFDYVDGNAATFLEELRTAMLARYLRGGSGEARTADYWRALFADPDRWAAAQSQLRGLDWDALFPGFPGEREAPRQANARLLNAYGARSEDYAIEIMRAAARAAHVLAGHIDAYANEGYLRTATQWESLRRLGAMVNYHPTPPASASTAIALIAASGPSLIDRGLAMKVTPPEGGRPLIFETLRPAWVHPALNALRARGAGHSGRTLDLTHGADFILPKDVMPVIGDLVAVTDGTAGVGAAVQAVSAGTGAARITLSSEVAGHGWIAGDTRLLGKPGAVLHGILRPDTGRVVIETASPARFEDGGVARMVDEAGTETFAVIDAVSGPFVVLATTADPRGRVSLTPLSAVTAAAGGWVETLTLVEHMYFNHAGTVRVGDRSATALSDNDARTSGTRSSGGNVVGYRFANQGTNGRGYILTAGAAVAGRVIRNPEVIAGIAPDLTATFTFLGKPPKDLAGGDVFVARLGVTLTALRVLGLTTAADRFHIQFSREPDVPAGGALQDVEFHGPMKQVLRPVDFDRNEGEAVAGGGVIEFEAVPDEAAALFAPGGLLIVEDEAPSPRAPALAHILSTAWNSAHTVLTVTVAEDAALFAGFRKGWTVFRGNTVLAGHGESLGSRVIGSGNGELPSQTFNLPLTDISFVPSNASETGIAPDIEVRVGDRFWAFRDLSDLEAEGAEAYSPTLAEDGSLDLHFRRRLVTGTDNVVVTRHRSGSGLRGNHVAPYSFTKPSEKHAVVTAIVQPFETSGGSEREAGGDIRVNAPGRLSANDRAVSVADFARLARRNAAVWQARSALKLAPGREQVVGLTIVPAGGGALTGSLRDALTDFVLAKAAPNTRLEIAGFTPLPVRIQAAVAVDAAHYARDPVKDAVRAALLAAFSLKRRSLGQGLFIGEILAVIESVPGIDHALATFTLASGSVPRSVPSSAGGYSAIFPGPDQAAFVAAPTDIALEDGA